MSKLIYKEALKESKDFGAFVGLRLDRVNNALEQAQKQEKLLELYEKLAEHRLRFINELLNKIAFLTVDKDIELEVKKYGDEDNKIIVEIEKIKELLYE